MKLKAIFFTFLVVFIFTSSQTIFAQNQGLEEENNSCPALFYAIRDNDREVVKLLLEYKVNPNASIENCPVYKIKLRRSKGLVAPFSELWNYDHIDYPEGSTLLHLTTYFYGGGMDMYNLFLKHEANNNILDANGNSPHKLAIGIPCLTQELQVASCFSNLGQFLEPSQNASAR